MAFTTNMTTTGTTGTTGNTTGLDPNQRKKPPILPFVEPGKNLTPVQPASNPFTADGLPFNFGATGAPGGQGVPQINPNQIQGIGSGYTPDQGNEAVLRAAQQRAMQGFQSPTLDQTSQLTQQLLQNPQMGFDPKRQLQQNLEAFDQQRAQAMEAARQQMAGTMHAGDTRGDFMDMAIQGGQQRAGFEAQQQEAMRQEQQRNLLAALAEGRSTSEAERQRFATDIGALTDVRGAAEGMENRALTAAESAMDRGMQIALANQDAQLQTSLTELQGKIQQGLLLTEQDFQGVQADLDRQLEKAIADGNWGNAVQIQQMQNDFAQQMQESQQQFQRAERVATQSWTTGERLDAQDHEQAMKWVDHEIAEAQANNNVERQEYLMGVQNKLDLAMQTSGFQHDEKMAYLGAQLEEAKAQNDVNRQKDIMSYAHIQEMDRIEKEQGFEASQNYLRQQHELAVQENDIVAQKALQEASIAASSREAALDRAHDIQIEQMRQDFEKAGLSWQAIMSNIESLPPDQAAQVLWEEGQKAGIEGLGPNPQYLKEAKAVRDNGGDATAWMTRANELGIPMDQAQAAWDYRGGGQIDTGYVQETATLLRNGGYKSVASNVDWGSPEGQAIQDAILKDPTVMAGYGTRGKDNTGKNRWTYSNFESAYDNGEPVIYENENGEKVIGFVVGKTQVTQFGRDDTEYQIQALDGTITKSRT